VWLHGAAADLLAAELGRGMTANNVADALPQAALQIRNRSPRSRSAAPRKPAGAERAT
jgi:hypothetical protein